MSLWHIDITVIPFDSSASLLTHRFSYVPNRFCGYFPKLQSRRPCWRNRRALSYYVIKENCLSVGDTVWAYGIKRVTEKAQNQTYKFQFKVLHHQNFKKH